MTRSEWERNGRPADDDSLVPSVTGPAMPSSLDPVITMGAVQRYVEAERRRNRRIVLWVASLFLLALLVILAVSVLVGVLVVRNSGRAVEIADRLRLETSDYLGEVAGVSNRLAELETRQAQVRESIGNWEDVRTRDTERFRVEVGSLGRSIEEGRLTVSQALAAVQSRLAAMETAADTARRDAAFVRQQYAALQAVAGEPAREWVAGNAALAPAVTAIVPSSEAPDEGMTAAPRDATSEMAFAVENIPPVKAPEGPMAIAVVTFPNGDRYEGQFKDGLFDGWGVYTYRDGDRFEGEFKDDMKNGRGAFVHRNGDRYTGAFVSDMKQGKGSLLFHNGDKYVGEFGNDMINGRGTMSYRNGNRYSGEFKNGLKHGSGIFVFPNGDTYRGEFRDDMRNGRGSYVSSDGAKYIGEFKDGKRHGQGRYTYPNGEEYSGEFKNGRMDGFGVYTYPNGSTVKVIWKDDKFQRFAES